MDARYAVLIADQNRQVLEDLTRDDVIPEEFWNGQHYLVGSAENEKDEIMTREEFDATFDILSSMIVHTIEKKNTNVDRDANAQPYDKTSGR